MASRESREFELVMSLEQRRQRWIREPSLWNASLYRDKIDDLVDIGVLSPDAAKERLAELERGVSGK